MIGRAVAVIFVLRILKAFSENGVKEFGALQLIYKISSFLGEFGEIGEALSMLVLMPLILVMMCPVIGSVCMYHMHKKFLNILSMFGTEQP